MRGAFALRVEPLFFIILLVFIPSVFGEVVNVTCTDNQIASSLGVQYTLCIGRNLLTPGIPQYKIKIPGVSADGAKTSLRIEDSQGSLVQQWPLIGQGEFVEISGIRFTINNIVPRGQDSYVVFTPTIQGQPGGGTNSLITIPIGRCSALGFNECDKLTGLYIYNYSNPGPLGSDFTLTIPSDSGGFSEAPLSDRLISCNNLSDITLAYYNSTNRAWVPINAALLNNRLVVRINFLGTFAIIKKPSCVLKECGPYGYYLIPQDGFVPVNNPLKFVVCGFLPGCQPAEPGCSRACPQDIDPQCPTCTKSSGNCCVPKLDNECDLDCARGVDPDCAQTFIPGEVNCDDDGTCNPQCPNSTTFKVTTTGLLNRNFMWYADVDCCRQYGSQITSNMGDCCRAVCDGVCDGDCITGQDPDCTYECPYCGDGKLNDVQYPERINAVNPNGYQYQSCLDCQQDCPGGANQFSFTQAEGDGGNAPGEGEENPGGTPGSGSSGQAPGAEEGFGGGFGETGY